MDEILNEENLLNESSLIDQDFDQDDQHDVNIDTVETISDLVY